MRAVQVAVAFALLVGLAAGGWMYSRQMEQEPEPPEDVGVETAEDDKLAELERESERLKKQLASEKSRTRRAEKQLQKAKGELETAQTELEVANAAPGMQDETAPEKPEVGDTAPRYSFEGYDEALRTVDWDSVGYNMAAMAPLLAKLADQMAEDGKPSPEVAGTVQKHNGPLVVAAMQLHEKKVPGFEVNGSFTHPAPMVNAIAATLEALGMPLTDAQGKALVSVGNDFTKRDDQRRAAYDEATLRLTKLCDEADLKHGFFADAFAVLTEEQRTALSPPQTRGRIAVDLFCEGLLWVGGRAQPLTFTDRDDLRTQLQDRVIRGLRVPAEREENARATIAEWVDDWPADQLDREMDALGGFGMIPATHAAQAGRHVTVLFERLLAPGDLDEATVKRIRGFGRTVVPYRKAPD